MVVRLKNGVHNLRGGIPVRRGSVLDDVNILRAAAVLSGHEKIKESYDSCEEARVTFLKTHTAP